MFTIIKCYKYRRKQPRWEKPSRIPSEVMESFYEELSGKQYMKVFQPNIDCEAYDTYVENVSEFLHTSDHSNDRIKRPSEIYFDDFDFAQNDEKPYIDRELKGIDKADWSDKTERDIMKGRRSSIGCDYLTAIGQHMRDIVINTILVHTSTNFLSE